MKIGVCMTAEEALVSFPAAADYVDILAYPLLSLSSDTRRALKSAVEDGSLPLYSSVCLFPGDMRLTGEDFAPLTVRDFCDRVLCAQAELGIKTVVFGSGGARRIPEGFPRDRAWAQLEETTAALADLAKGYGQRIAIEPLSAKEDNTFNTVGQTVSFLTRLGRDNLGVTLDFYHFHNGGEDFSVIRENRDRIFHAHIASHTRKMMESDEDWRIFGEEIALLREIGYTGNLTFEGAYSSIDELSPVAAGIKAHL